MMITRVRLAHVRGIKNLELDLNERTTILIGQPATGKSTVLDALSIGLAVTGRLTRNFEKRDAGGTGTEPSIEIAIPDGTITPRRGGDRPTTARVIEHNSCTTPHTRGSTRIRTRHVDTSYRAAPLRGQGLTERRAFRSES